ncbi:MULTISPECIES: TadE/TadG family type IV pilus assembly protein [unclassified Sphingomonas]|uniref:TadE/TadG family type IV pilus assembly protein n=1 Tax=unclassified Sphingomonas TaxID=196159 RepID=UPI0026ABB223
MIRMAPLPQFLARLHRDTSGLALLEFAFALPILLLMSLTGAELTNYITTKMRMSQIALHLADNAARIGTGSQLAAKTITEADINDLFTGANLQAGELNLQANGRVIVTSLEPTASPNTAGTYKIGWRRCYGAKTTYARKYPTGTGTTGLTGLGPTGRQVTAPDNGATMFIEVYYEYRPIVRTSLAPDTSMTEIASMIVRDRRDTSQVYAVTGVTASTC